MIDSTVEHACLEVEYYLGLTPKGEQSFQGLVDHLSLDFQSCKAVSSLIGNFYNCLQKPRESEDTFIDKLQTLMYKIVAHKSEFLGKAYQALKHQYMHHLRDPYFRVLARG